MSSLKPSLAFYTHTQVSDILKHLLFAHSHILLEGSLMSNKPKTRKQDASNLVPLLTICVALTKSLHPRALAVPALKEPKASALWQPRGMGWEGRWEGGSKGKGRLYM